MNPRNYGLVYANLPMWFDDGSGAWVLIRNYLQNGMGEQSARAQRAKGALEQKIAKELGVPGSIPALFKIEGYEIQRSGISRVFMGKGAPSEIQDVLWLADRYDLLNSGNVQTYCDNNLGIDCGGLVACLWGIGKPVGGRDVQGSTGFLPRSFWNFDRTKRRARTTDIQIGDAIIFFIHIKNDDTDLANIDPTLGGEAHHIGAVAGIQIHENTIDLWILEAAGAKVKDTIWSGNGVNYRLVTGLKIKSARGLVYGDAGGLQKSRLYFVGKKNNSAPYLPYWTDEGVYNI